MNRRDFLGSVFAGFVLIHIQPSQPDSIVLRWFQIYAAEVLETL